MVNENGNGSNQLLDDNGKVGIVARAELDILKYARVSAAVFKNDRTVRHASEPSTTEEDFRPHRRPPA